MACNLFLCLLFPGMFGLTEQTGMGSTVWNLEIASYQGSPVDGVPLLTCRWENLQDLFVGEQEDLVDCRGGWWS